MIFVPVFFGGVIIQVLREFYINPADVHYFCHDSASYMGPAAARMQKDMGYVNMLSVPCWAHLLNILGSVIFDQNVFPILQEYLRLTRFFFLRTFVFVMFSLHLQIVRMGSSWGGLVI